MKDFNEYLRILTTEENKIKIDQIIAESAREEAQAGNNLAVYLYDVIDAVTDFKLRLYHEWAFGDSDSGSGEF